MQKQSNTNHTHETFVQSHGTQLAWYTACMIWLQMPHTDLTSADTLSWTTESAVHAQTRETELLHSGSSEFQMQTARSCKQELQLESGRDRCLAGDHSGG